MFCLIFYCSKLAIFSIILFYSEKTLKTKNLLALNIVDNLDCLYSTILRIMHTETFFRFNKKSKKLSRKWHHKDNLVLPTMINSCIFFSY